MPNFAKLWAPINALIHYTTTYYYGSIFPLNLERSCSWNVEFLESVYDVGYDMPNPPLIVLVGLQRGRLAAVVKETQENRFVTMIVERDTASLSGSKSWPAAEFMRTVAFMRIPTPFNMSASSLVVSILTVVIESFNCGSETKQEQQPKL